MEPGGLVPRGDVMEPGGLVPHGDVMEPGGLVPGRSREEVATAGGRSTDLTVVVLPSTLTFSATATDRAFLFFAFVTVLGLNSFLGFRGEGSKSSSLSDSDDGSLLSGW